ncbi:colanic acid biosynthesis glycosyl transferase [Kouleothrix aurantiaca]|jgi:glycosyltransferase involved in cell wall biosynthesis|uniref:Colanic acid biosynthesis glycosyl transferase n=1 Tax=Kouleothrix aurantiaca TaxID=186479 RepID=A0A0P9DL51_9CHLR|nr:colanic acid biosynthesis glycosyl transferase [Kouleothrix aurantiaca]
MSRFPKLSETFVLYEMLALQQQGVDVEVFPLINERAKVVHAEAKPFVERAHYLPVLSLPILKANLHFLRKKPAAYLRVWLEVLRGTFGSMNYMVGGLGIIPKAAKFAYDMQRMGVRHVHAHFANHPAVAALVINRLTGIPFSFTAHAHDIYVDQHMLKEKVQAAKFVVAISEYNKALITRHAGEAMRDKIKVVHCGVDTSLFQPRQKPASDGLFTIVCVGSLEEKKGQTYLVEACRLLKQRGLRFVCHLIGDGQNRADLEEQVRRDNLGDVVKLAGGIPRAEVLKMLAKADVVALPSIRTKSGKMEGIPVALMEPLACEVPVVSTQTSGIPELVEDGVTGLLVPPENPAALADALQRLANDPELGQRMGRAGREKVLREFDLNDNAATLVQLMIGGAR